MVTLDLHIHSVVAGIDAIGIVSSQTDLVLVNGNCQSGALTGGTTGRTGAGGSQITGAQVGEVQGFLRRTDVLVILPTCTGLIVAPTGHSCHRHLGTLGIVILAGFIILMVVTEEEDNILFCRYRIDGIEPILSPCIIITVVIQRLVGCNQQRLALVQLCGICLEVGNCLLDGGREALGSTVIGSCSVVKTCTIAVIAAQITHRQGIDIVIAVIVSTVGTVSTGTVNQTAGLVQRSLAGSVVIGIAVMVRPYIVHINSRISQAVGATDVTGKGIGIAGILGVVCVDGECITATGNRSNGQTGFLKRGHDSFNCCLLIVAFVGMQVTEHDRRIIGRFFCCKCADGQNANQHHQNQKQCKQFLHLLHRFSSLNFLQDFTQNRVIYSLF